MNKNNLKMLFVGLGIVNIVCLLIFNYVNVGVSFYKEGASFFEIADVDIATWLVVILPIISVVLALTKDNLEKLAPIITIAIHVLNFFALRFLINLGSYGLGSMSPAMGFYISIILLIGMIVVSTMHKTAVE